MDLATREFIAHVKSDLKEHGVEPKFVRERSIDMDGVAVNGYFCHEDMVLACAFDQPEEQWIPLLAHEYSHFIQWKDKREPYWLMRDHPLTEKYETNIDTISFDWVNGSTDISDEDGKLALDLSRNMELDCERVTIGVLKQFGLPVDITRYCQKANAYVQFYNLMKDTRKWYTIGQEPYNDSVLVDMMPDNLDSDCLVLAEDIHKVMKERC